MDSDASDKKELLPVENILIFDRIEKDDLFQRMIRLLSLSPEITDAEELRYGIFEREKLMSTGVGQGLGIPHVRLRGATDMVLAAALVREGVSGYDSIDGKLVQLVIMIAGRQDQQVRHLRLLSQISGTLHRGGVWEDILAAGNAATLRRALENVVRIPEIL